MRSKLRPEWYALSIEENFDLNRSGIYEWRIAGVGIYVGKAKTLRRRIRDYPNNVRRMINGLAWHGNSSKDYRQIHHELRRAYDSGTQVSVAVLEICDPSSRAERERHWIEQRRKEHLAGGPRVLNSN
ncbi:GIY-YIG nuclease family protein [Sphingomonas sp. dw_22]|uniref:GIY-YIG nuclease family protein n=1 Tax=Sphingomonas sp. dw_22 TaxID=2721175 RepID=UPI001BD23072|nr:GIY-YIG nuclease family protein [Sphingomonas sp. dw_22]